MQKNLALPTKGQKCSILKPQAIKITYSKTLHPVRGILIPNPDLNPFHRKIDNGQSSSGFFMIQPPYKGLKLGMLFSQAYCSLAKKIRELWETNPNLVDELKNQWKTAIASSERYTLDTLMDQHDVHINFSDFTITDVVDHGATLLIGNNGHAKVS